jgi:putative pyruvate formate lyase activating enzyme
MAIFIAAKDGLKIPIVYNTGGYDSVETLKLLDGIIDIYMPDFKYWDKEIALKLSGVKKYPHFTRLAIKEMRRQVGDLVIDRHGIAQKGVIVRHLALPENQSGTEEIARFISEEISKDTYINIMDQYRPCFNAHKYPEISKRISHNEYNHAIETAKKYGLWRFDKNII